MKKFMAICLMLVLTALTLSACTQQPGENGGAQSGKLNIVATIFPQYDFARAVTGDRADLTLLLHPGAESHSYEPSPKDIIKIQKSDIFIYVGGESDEWIDGILSSLDTSSMQIIKLMDCVDPVVEEDVPGMEGGHEEDGDGYEYDEHVWTSPKNAIKITQAISDAACKADSENASYYKEKTVEYVKELGALDAGFQEAADNGKRKTLVFGDRFPFRYFTDAYGLSYLAAFPGCSSETEPSAATLANLIDHVKKEHIPYVFYIELSDEKVADTICEATGAKKLLFHSCHNLTKNEFESGATYVSLMKNNLKNLETALN